MVKSRRSASARQSRPKRTLAWRPKVSTSSRKRRDFERPAVDHDGDGAVLDAGRHRLEARRGCAPDHLLRDRGGGDVEFADRLAEQRIPHRAADHARLLAVAVEHLRAGAPSAPSRSHAASLSRAGGSLTAPRPGHEIAAFVDMGRLVGRARRRAGEMREIDEAADHQDQRADAERGQDLRRPGRHRQQRRLGRHQIDARRPQMARETARAR